MWRGTCGDGADGSNEVNWLIGETGKTGRKPRPQADEAQVLGPIKALREMSLVFDFHLVFDFFCCPLFFVWLYFRNLCFLWLNLDWSNSFGRDGEEVQQQWELVVAEPDWWMGFAICSCWSMKTRTQVTFDIQLAFFLPRKRKRNRERKNPFIRQYVTLSPPPPPSPPLRPQKKKGEKGEKKILC